MTFCHFYFHLSPQLTKIHNDLKWWRGELNLRWSSNLKTTQWLFTKTLKTFNETIKHLSVFTLFLIWLPHLLNESNYCRVFSISVIKVNAIEEFHIYYITDVIYSKYAKQICNCNCNFCQFCNAVFSFIVSFLASEPISSCRPRRARWMYEQLSAFFFSNSYHWESFLKVVHQSITLQYVLNIISEKGRTLMKTA